MTTARDAVPEPELVVTVDGPVEHWVLNRPAARNALSPTLVDALADAFAAASGSGVRVVVLSGAGRGFSAGADLTHLLALAQGGRSPRPFLQSICDLTVEMEQSPIVFVAALHGHAVAGGLELALACDLVIAASETAIGDGHVKNNLVPGGGSTVRIERRLGAGAASWLGLSGATVPAEDLRASGWIHRITLADELIDVALQTAHVLAAVPAQAQASFKRSLAPSAEATRHALSAELDAFEQHWHDADVASHLRRFLRLDPEDSIHV